MRHRSPHRTSPIGAFHDHSKRADNACVGHRQMDALRVRFGQERAVPRLDPMSKLEHRFTAGRHDIHPILHPARKRLGVTALDILPASPFPRAKADLEQPLVDAKRHRQRLRDANG